MTIPGINIFSMASTIIWNQNITYYKYLGRTTNEIGQYVPNFDTGTTIKGSFQPIPRSLYRAYGLDLQRRYFTLYTSVNVLDINRNVSSDQIVFKNIRYQCESNIDWHDTDGWKGVLCVGISE